MESDMETEAARLASLANDAWQNLMDRVIDSYRPGTVMAPGPKLEEPMSPRDASVGHLALVMGEALDAVVSRGTDRDEFLDQVAQDAGEDYSRQDVDAILSDDNKCPDIELLSAFCDALSIDTETAVDAAQRGGCTNYGAATVPPGY